jgi:hypothetical protein
MSIENEFTVEELIDEIRAATNLDDLQKLVGPSEFELKLSKERLRQIDKIADKTSEQNEYDRRRYLELMRQQDRFESKYF